MNRSIYGTSILLLLFVEVFFDMDAAVSDTSNGRIGVGRNIQISKDRSGLEHGEAVICASLSDPELLIAGSVAVTNGKQFLTRGEITGQIAYYSRDNGKTWQYAFDIFDWAEAVDAACAYGPDGSAHFSTMAAPSMDPQRLDLDFKLLNYRSPDGGATWEKPVILPAVSGADRQYMAFDTSGGEYHGRLYMGYAGQFNQRTIEGRRWSGAGSLYGLSRSLDSGKSWGFPAIRISDRGFHNGNLAVFSDGTVIGSLGFKHPDASSSYAEALLKGGPYTAGEVAVITSKDGGEFISTMTKVNDLYMPVHTYEHMVNPLAIDASGAYKDRVYIAWNDARSGRYQVLLSYSTDKGNTWSLPFRVSDDKPFDVRHTERGPDSTAPWIAVNKYGVVGVFWLDRSDRKNRFNYHARFSASLDGGETWLPSVQVSEQSIAPRIKWQTPQYLIDHPAPADKLRARLEAPMWDFNGGDMNSMTVDADGNFHPIWADARTGVRQLYTAKISVKGKVVPEVKAALGNVDVTSSLSMEFISSTEEINWKKGVIKTRVRLKNKGKEIIHGPLSAHVTALSTHSAQRINVANSDNGQSTIGAMWYFPVAGGSDGLKPGETTEARELVFQLFELKEGNPPLYFKDLGGGMIIQGIGGEVVGLDVIVKGSVKYPVGQ